MIKPLIFRKMAGRVASAHDIEVFEKDRGIRLPPSFIEFCQRFNGGFPDLENRFYLVPTKFHEFHDEYAPSSSNQIGVTIDGLFGLTTDLHACDIRAELLDLLEACTIRLLPVGFDLLGNQVVLREDVHDGAVFWRDHELWVEQNVPMLFPIADDLESFYNSLTIDPLVPDSQNG